MTKSISFFGSRRPLELPIWLVELGNELAPCLSRYFSDSLRKFWTDVRAAAMAGLPKPCVMRLKCVRLRCMPESRTGCTRPLLHSGDRSCPSSSTNSFSTCLQRKKSQLEVSKGWWSVKQGSLHVRHTYLVAIINSFLLNRSESVWLRFKYSAICLEGNSVSQTYRKSRAKWMASPVKSAERNSKVTYHLPRSEDKVLWLCFTVCTNCTYLQRVMWAR